MRHIKSNRAQQGSCIQVSIINLWNICPNIYIVIAIYIRMYTKDGPI